MAIVVRNECIRSGKRKGAVVERATGVVKIEGGLEESFVGVWAEEGIFGMASRVSPLSHVTALALRFSYGQCSRVSRMKVRRTISEGWERRIVDVR